MVNRRSNCKCLSVISYFKCHPIITFHINTIILIMFKYIHDFFLFVHTTWQINCCLDGLPVGVLFTLIIDGCYVGDMVNCLKKQFDETVSRGLTVVLYTSIVLRRQSSAEVTFFYLRYIGLTKLFLYIIQENNGKITKINLLKELCKVTTENKEINEMRNIILFANDE